MSRSDCRAHAGGCRRSRRRAGRGRRRILASSPAQGRPEARLPDFAITVWFAMYAPKGTPQPIIDALSKTLQQAISDPETKGRFAGSGAQTVSTDRATPAALRAFLHSRVRPLGPIIKKAGVTAE